MTKKKNLIWLTDVLKSEIVNKLKNKIKNKEIDEGLEKYLLDLNKIDGIVTADSCAGHEGSKAHLYLQTTEAMGKILEDKIPELVECDFISLISKLYFIQPITRETEVCYKFVCYRGTLPDLIEKLQDCLSRKALDADKEALMEMKE